MNKIFLTLFFVLFVFSTSQAKDLIQKNEKGGLDAQIENVKLSELTTFIKKSYGVEFKGQDTLFQAPITVSFKNLNVEQMLKKILARKNYVFTYNNQGKVTEVTLLAAGNNKSDTGQTTNIVKNEEQKPGPGSSPDISGGSNSKVDAITSFKPVKIEQGSDKNQASDDITSFKVVPNVPPPGGELTKDKTQAPDDITSFKVVPNAPPPGK